MISRSKSGRVLSISSVSTRCAEQRVLWDVGGLLEAKFCS
jgi:hypothetical protein